MKWVKHVIWFLVTVWLGSKLLYRLLKRLWGLRIFLSETRTCPRGHKTPIYGVYECRCRALIEGFVFRKCPVCKESAAWTPCRKCGLPLRNPLL